MLHSSPSNSLPRKWQKVKLFVLRTRKCIYLFCIGVRERLRVSAIEVAVVEPFHSCSRSRRANASTRCSFSCLTTFSTRTLLRLIPTAGRLGDDEVVREVARLDGRHCVTRLAAALMHHREGMEVAGVGVVTLSVTQKTG
jgi:hypothetical protein